jgi:hypothetical protein
MADPEESPADGPYGSGAATGIYRGWWFDGERNESRKSIT